MDLKELEMRELEIKLEQKESELNRTTQKLHHEDQMKEIHKLHVKEEPVPAEPENNEEEQPSQSIIQNPMNESSYSSQWKNAKKKRRQSSLGQKSRYMSSANKETSKRAGTDIVCSGAVASVTSPNMKSIVVGSVKSMGPALQYSAFSNNRPTGHKHQKIVPLKQLKEIINDIYL